MKIFSLFLFCCLWFSCGSNADRQNIDLSDAVVDRPVDGVGHYVYALSVPNSVVAGEEFEIQMEWRTVGSVDPNARYTMDIILQGPDTKVYSIPSGANTVGELHLANWLSYPLTVPADFAAGTYTVGVRLRDSNRDFAQVPLGYKEERAMSEGFYRLAAIEITDAS